MKNIRFLLIGMAFGIVLVKGEIISWFRIQEMFRFQSFHMFGIILSALSIGLLSIWLIKKFNVKSLDGTQIQLAPKKFTKGNVIGGMMFGFGWALTGACPGPLYALLGSGYTVIIMAIGMALLGTYTYGALRERLPQ